MVIRAHQGICWYEYLKHLPETHTSEFTNCHIQAPNVLRQIKEQNLDNVRFSFLLVSKCPKKVNRYNLTHFFQKYFGDWMIDLAMGHLPENYQSCDSFLKVYGSHNIILLQCVLKICKNIELNMILRFRILQKPQPQITAMYFWNPRKRNIRSEALSIVWLLSWRILMGKRLFQRWWASPIGFNTCIMRSRCVSINYKQIPQSRYLIWCTEGKNYASKALETRFAQSRERV